jgi:addiction module RelE/StbE family toxin
MNIDYSRAFDKQYSKLTQTKKRSVRDAIEIFIDEPYHEGLRNHPLKEKWVGYRSISADNDLRLHFKILNDETALFVAVGTHKQLYK